MTAQDFHEARARRMLTEVPVWWFEKANRQGEGWPVDGDAITMSFSKRPDSPRFPTPPFARVPKGERG